MGICEGHGVMIATECELLCPSNIDWMIMIDHTFVVDNNLIRKDDFTSVFLGGGIYLRGKNKTTRSCREGKLNLYKLIEG